MKGLSKIMDRNKLYSLLLDAMEEYGADDIVGVLNNILEELEVKKVKAEKQKQKYEDAIELYRQILLYGTTYYPDLMPEDSTEELMRVAEKDPRGIVEMFSKCFIAMDDPVPPTPRDEPTPAPTPKSAIKVKTNINGKEDEFDIDVDQWFNTLTDFFDRYNI